jgi:hypothetical protein
MCDGMARFDRLEVMHQITELLCGPMPSRATQRLIDAEVLGEEKRG